jgi:hypothetical protein
MIKPKVENSRRAEMWGVSGKIAGKIAKMKILI